MDQSNQGGIVTRLQSWATMPLTQGSLTIGDLALFLVLATCAAIFWTRILKHVVRDTAETILEAA